MKLVITVILALLVVTLMGTGGTAVLFFGTEGMFTRSDYGAMDGTSFTLFMIGTLLAWAPVWFIVLRRLGAFKRDSLPC